MEKLYKINDKYSITKTGKIWSKRSKRFLKLSVNNSGYQSCYIGFKELVHRIMAKVFLNAPDKFVVNHINGIKTDNRLSNLEVLNYKRNSLHSRNNLGKKGKKLTVNDVIEIIKIKSLTNIKTKDLAKKFNVNRQTISGIFTGNFWKIGSYPKIDEARKSYPVKIRHKRFLKNNEEAI